MKVTEAEKILGLNSGYDMEILRSTYKNKAIKFHPDNSTRIGLTKEEATKKFQKINEAFTILKKNLEVKNDFSKNNANTKSSKPVDVRDYTNDISSMLYQQIKNDQETLQRLKNRFNKFDASFFDMCQKYVNSLSSQKQFFDFTFCADIDEVVELHNSYIEKRENLLHEINKTFWEFYYHIKLVNVKGKEVFL